jgi:hypothetical protein
MVLEHIRRKNDNHLKEQERKDMLLRQLLLQYLQNIRSLPIIQYNNEKICYRDINVFNLCSKNMNDANNKKRENIIGSIIDNTRIRMDAKNPFNDYYRFSRRWSNIKDALFNYIDKELNININKDITLTHKGGRKYNYDFEIASETAIYYIELKFNIDNVSKAPQFVSPYNPSKYMSSSYEEYFYDNYLPCLTSLRDDLIIPDKRTYLLEVNSTTPNCMKKYQEIYYNGCKASSRYTNDTRDIEFYKLANKLSQESIIAFISATALNIDMLNDYLRSSQKDKIYMLYKNGKFYKQVIEPRKYMIVSYTKYKNKFIAKTQDGNDIKILLRWKNGNGIAFPAFQIS